ncbi:hypothetical protein [Mesomycoplasma ovipneumoniae]|uniref:hypothetical protein n=1 Tax=Mesomycoplasma ovipneumoniae TaxID=29562 RepID=UPI002964500A|nr:hypothetical protein [Mesomycoplasma ovipneumoniae]MDW2920494.1 hypothetical protein [Mesomycoplasma ovipneumoniae]
MKKLNNDFLEIIKESFISYLHKGSSRSNEKIKIIHSFVANSMLQNLGQDFKIYSLGFDNGNQFQKEAKIIGRYYDKKVDIGIEYKNEIIAGIGLKFVVQNYLQNSINYFENMLGETANIRSQNDKLYFQILIIFEQIPYFSKNRINKKWEKLNYKNFLKYAKLSTENQSDFRHIPNKVWIVIINFACLNLENKSKHNNINEIENFEDYKTVANFHLDNCFNALEFSNILKPIETQIQNSVIINDYDDFINRISYLIKGHVKN